MSLGQQYLITFLIGFSSNITHLLSGYKTKLNYKLLAESLPLDSSMKSPLLTVQPNQSISKQQLRERIKRTRLCIGKPP